MSFIETAAVPQGLSPRARALAGLPLRAVRDLLAWRRRREGIRLLLELDDRLLRDAGFIRAELERMR